MNMDTRSNSKRTKYPPQERKYRANPGYGAQAGCPVHQYPRIHVPFGPAVFRKYRDTQLWMGPVGI